MDTNQQNPIKIVGLVPARGGSKRIHNKNLQVIGGKSLLRWSVEAAQKCGLIDSVVVSTDSDEYARIARSWGAQVLIRPPELCSDTATDEDVLKHFFEHFPCDLCIYLRPTTEDVLKHFFEHFPCDLCVYLRPTTPFREVSVIENAIKAMLQNMGSVDSLRSVEEMGESAWKTFEITNNLLKPICGKMDCANLPNQMVNKTYRGNGYVDILRGPQWGERVLAFVTPRVIEIDNPEDLEYARWWKEVKKG